MFFYLNQETQQCILTEPNPSIGKVVQDLNSCIHRHMPSIDILCPEERALVIFLDNLQQSSSLKDISVGLKSIQATLAGKGYTQVSHTLKQFSMALALLESLAPQEDILVRTMTRLSTESGVGISDGEVSPSRVFLPQKTIVSPEQAAFAEKRLNAVRLFDGTRRSSVKMGAEF